MFSPPKKRISYYFGKGNSMFFFIDANPNDTVLEINYLNDYELQIGDAKHNNQKKPWIKCIVYAEVEEIKKLYEDSYNYFTQNRNLQ